MKKDKGSKKSNFIFWNFENQKEWKNRGKTKHQQGRGKKKKRKRREKRGVIFLKSQGRVGQ
jgi:hypothetical protein